MTSVRVVLLRYCPEVGALVPGVSLEVAILISSLLLRGPTLTLGVGAYVTCTYCLCL